MSVEDRRWSVSWVTDDGEPHTAVVVALNLSHVEQVAHQEHGAPFYAITAVSLMPSSWKG